MCLVDADQAPWDIKISGLANTSFWGGERVADFATLAIEDMELSGIVAAIILAGFAGMSEYVTLVALVGLLILLLVAYRTAPR